MPRGKKLTIEYIKDQFEREGYELLTTEYINCRQKLDYICPEGHRHVISWNKWGEGRRCVYCFGAPKKTIEEIRKSFEGEEYKLLTTEYINAFQKLEFICPKGHKHSICWGSWQQGHRCGICGLNRCGKIFLSYKFIRDQFEKEGYRLLIEEYKNNNQRLDYICPRGHKHSISWHNWQKGQRCFYCYGNIKPTIEFIVSEFVEEGYRLLTTEYKNAHQKLNYICSKGHKGISTWNNWKNGHRCPYCFGSISNGEVEVRNFVGSLGIEISPNDRSQIFNSSTNYGLELDIFMPIFKKAIEYNGEYWHQDKDRDLFKQQLCESKGIDLLTVWDKEWKINNRKCKEKIMKFIFNNSLNFIGPPKNFGECI